MKRFLSFLASGMLFAGATFQAAAITEPVTVSNERESGITDSKIPTKPSFYIIVIL